MSRNITIKDIAASANVSKSTVSRVLNNSSSVNDQKREAVQEAMKRLNYKPNLVARSLAGGSSLTLGIVTQNIGSPFYDLVTQGVIHSVTGSDYSPIFADGRWDPKIEIAAIDTLLERNVDGLIMIGGNLTGEKMTELCGTKPVIVVARSIEGWDSRSIAIDNQVAAEEAVKYLIDSGHRKIAHISGIDEHQDAADRFSGYKKALQEANLELNDDLVAKGDFSSQSGVLAVESLLMRGESFTAIFAANDEMAMGARLALYRRGVRVPEDVSIVGFDDQPSSAFMTPPLTTVAQPAMEMGMAAATAVLGILTNVEPEPKPKFETKLIIRESVKRLR